MIADHKKTAEINALKQCKDIKYEISYYQPRACYISTVTAAIGDDEAIFVSELHIDSQHDTLKAAPKGFSRYIFQQQRIERNLIKSRLR